MVVSKCRKCGNILHWGAVSCPHCGSQVYVDSSPPGKERPRKAKKEIPVSQIILFVGAILLGIAIFQIRKYTGKGYIVEALYKEPVQGETDKPPFQAKPGGRIYTVTPLYEYELWGLVVSCQDTERDNYQEAARDFLNIRDICVIWGENVKEQVYKAMSCRNISYRAHPGFRPEFRYGKSRKLWAKYKNENLSNNHLLSSGEEISRKIMSVREGDQIYLKGYLVEYGGRESSRTRTDNGCEVIYVTDFQVLKKGDPVWRFLYF